MGLPIFLKGGSNLNGYEKKSEVITFRKKVLLPGANVTMKERIKGKATVENVSVTFYQGQKQAVIVRPYIMKHGDVAVELFTYPEGGDKFVFGENETVKGDVRMQVDNDEYVYVYAENTSGVDTFSVVVDVAVDYYGGMDRVV